MALLKRELHRQVKGPQVTHEDLWTLVFDTDSKCLYVEHHWMYSEARTDGTTDFRRDKMDIANYLTQSGQTAGHRELWRILRKVFNESVDSANSEGETVSEGA